MKTLVLGASINPERASHKCVVLLEQAGYQVVAIGLRPGLIGNQQIKTEYTNFEGIHTISLYLGPKNQTEEIHNFIISLNPERVIFNPGTENPCIYREPPIFWNPHRNLLRLGAFEHGPILAMGTKKGSRKSETLFYFL